MLHKSFKSSKCKTALNLAKARVKIMKNKKDVQMRQLRREIAQLLQNGQDQTARIRVEHVIREENTLAAYEMIEIYCELTVARLPIIESQKNCPLDLKEAIASLIFAAPRCGDITELQDIRKHFTAKYGKDFAAAAVELRPACGVSRTLVEKLSVNAPDGPTKLKNLKGIAEEHNIKWEPNWFKEEDTVSSSDMPRKLQTDNDSRIQMQPLNVQIADDPEEKHSHGSEKKEKPAQRHPRANVNVIPPSSTSHPIARPSENDSEEMLFSQSSGSAADVVPADRQQWNMEFKDAASAAQAAAESAERASMAARAAAELSIRDSYRHGQENPIKSSSNYRTSNMEGHQGSTNQQGGVSEGRDGRRSNNEYNQSGVQYDSRQQEFRGSESTPHHENADNLRQSRDSMSGPSTSRGDHNQPNSSNIQEYETESVENPFHGPTVEPQNQPSKLDSQSSGSGDEYGVFSNLHYRKDDIHSDHSFDAFSHERSEDENWGAKTTYVSKSNSITGETNSRNYEERNVFKDPDEKNYGFDSSTWVFVGMDQKPSGSEINEKVGHNVATALFDESGSDNDEECILDSTEKCDFSSGKSSPEHVLVHKTSHHFEPDLSESFRSSSLYSKLIEPLPITFDDYDGSSPRSEKELETENTKPETGNHSYRNPDWDSHATIGFLRSSKATDDTFERNKRMEENQNIFEGSVDEGNGSESPRLFSLPVESKDRSEINDETYTSPKDDVELNLGSLPGGQRNRTSWRPPYTKAGFADISSPTSEAAINDGFGEREDRSPTYKSQGSSGRMSSEHVSTNYNAPGNYEPEIAHTCSKIAEPSYTERVYEDVPKTRAKDPAGYFEFDESVQEDVPIPVMSKRIQGTGISRRTKGSKTKSVSSRPSSNHVDTAKTEQFSPSYAAKDASMQETETTNSSSRIIHQLGRNDDAPYVPQSERTPVAVEKPATPTSADIPKASMSSEKAPGENSGKKPSHVHPKLPDFETFTAHLQSLRTNRQ